MPCKYCQCIKNGALPSANLIKQRDICEKNLNGFVQAMDLIIDGADSLDDEMAKIKNKVDMVLNNYVTKPLFAIMSIQDILKMPAEIITSISNKVEGYVSFIETIINNDVITYSEKSLQNLFVTTSVSAASLATTFGAFKDRGESVYVSNKLISMKDTYNIVVSNTEGKIEYDITEIFKTGEDYVFDVSITDSINNLISTTVNWLEEVVYDLPMRQSIILNSDRQYIELCHELYGSLDNLDKFISDNNITGDEFFILRKGRNIAYYREAQSA